ncbi:hypothetical protein IOD16_12660 [Saccharothrix sp. 6-C]|uniref:hypothetical protein n=1 Tax=Saccharothrix sp. 6-C TaxID=2781735 RepID=UPI001916EA8B|nr:hypothetical protein [Saccharothrix sp. 6-C]QQQ79202.1 hypothetical protein IOD16_12660 [Saccharothrix sp. 6-C]
MATTSGSATIIADCVKGCLSSYECAPKWGPTIAGQLDRVRADVGATVKAIEEVLDAPRARAATGSSSSPTPRRCPPPAASGSPRAGRGGRCPVWDSDADWAREHLVPTIAGTLKRVAADRGVRFLGLRDSFDGREVCPTDSRQATRTDSAANPLPGTVAEWVRWVVTGYASRGDRQESMHPNHYGQRAGHVPAADAPEGHR